MTDKPRTWNLTVARHQAALDDALVALANQVGPEHLVVVVRSREGEDRVRALLPFPQQVHTLADLLGAASPAACTEDDLLPDLLVHRLVADTLSPAHKDRRDAVAAEYLDAIRLLAANGITPPYPASSSDPLEDGLEAAHTALLEALHPYNEQGRYAAFQRVLLAHTGPSRLHARFPGIRAVALSGIDWLSPAEEYALETVLKDQVDVHVFAVGRPPRRKGDAESGPEGPHARWVALEHTDRFVRWAAHWRTAPHVELDASYDEGLHPRRRVLDRLFSLHPHAPVPLPQTHLLRPADPEEEVVATARRIRATLDAGAAPERVAVVVPHLERYADRLRDSFDAHGIPFTIRHSAHLHATPPGTLLALLFADLDHGHERDTFLDLVAHPLFRWSWGEGGRRTTLLAPWLRKTLARHGLSPRGTKGWRSAFDRIAEARQQEAVERRAHLTRTDGDDTGDPDNKDGKSRVKAADTAVRPTGEDVHRGAREDEPDGPDSFFNGQRDAALALLERLDALEQARDPETFFTLLRALLADSGLTRRAQRAMRHSDDPRGLALALEALLGLLDDTQRAFRLHATANGGRSHGAVREALMRRLHATPLPLATDRSWGVQVLALRNAAGLRFDEVHLIGAVADQLPTPRRPPRLQRLLERRFGPARLRRLDEEKEARRIVHGLLADCEGRVYLSAPRSEDGAPQPPSVLLEELEDAYVLEHAPALDPHRLHTHIDLQRVAATEAATWAGAPLQLSAARQMLAARCDPTDMGPYTGHLTDPAVRAAARTRTLAGGTAVSASRLNRYARCPHHALWYDIARIREDEARDEGLSPLDKGNLVHTIIDRWTRDLIDRHGAPAKVVDAVDEGSRLAHIATGVLVAVPFHGLGWDAYKAELLGGLPGSHPYVGVPRGILSRFLDDMVTRDVGVLASEVDFGQDDPLTIATPAGDIGVRGTIDRIETTGDGLQVLDLKTGDPPRRADTLGGVDLQVPLYVLATAHLHPDIPVVRAGYYKLKRARKKDVGLDQVVPAEDEPPQILEGLVQRSPERLAAILDAERTGHHPLTLLSEADAKCRYCDHRLLCGRRPHLTPRRRAFATGQGPAWGYVPDRVREMAGRGEDDEEESDKERVNGGNAAPSRTTGKKEVPR